MYIRRLLLIFIFTLVLPSGLPPTAAVPLRPLAPRMRYLDNGRVRVGVNLAMGGAITWISKSGGRENLINDHDLGREIQMSDYSGPVPYIPPGAKILPVWRNLGWNPIQAGDVFGWRSRTVYFKNTGTRMVVRCIPMIWPLDHVPAHCTFRTSIRLQGDTIHVHAKMEAFRRNKIQYPGHGQECPAIYTIGRLWRLISYTGRKPFTHQAVHWLDPRAVVRREQKEVQRHQFPWIAWHATENWAALVNRAGFGIGIWTPGDYLYLGGFTNWPPGQGGSRAAPTGYIAPIFHDIIDHNIDYRYRYVLIVGTLKQIRNYAYKHAGVPKPPQWVFTNNRQHWIYHDATDTGWPIRGRLDVSLRGAHPQLIGPDWFWRAREAPDLYLYAAFKTTRKTGAVWWRGFHNRGFAPARRVFFPIHGDGRYHHYVVNLSGAKTYRGAMIQLRIDPVRKGQPGAWVKVRSIGLGR